MSSGEPVLMPPSSFESSRPNADPWKALAKATSEILDLKQQNTKLQENKHISIPAGEEIKARVDLHQHRSSPVQPTFHHTSALDVSHYHDMISRQATENAQLREQLAQTTSKYDRQVAQLEGQLTLKESRYAHQLVGMEDRLGLLNTQYDIERRKLENSKSKCEDDHMTAVSQWEQELESSRQAHTQEVSQLQTQLKQLQQQQLTIETQLEDKSREYQTKIEEQSVTIKQLKTYLTDSENSSKSTEIWRKELENSKEKLQLKETERNKMESELDLVNIRLKSQNDLLVIQEKELSKVKDCSMEKKKQCLLTRWREKVLELLIQMKCAEITQDDQNRQWNNKIHNTENECESWRTQCEMLQCLVTDKQAQLDIQTNNVKSVEAELMRAQQVAIMLDDKCKADQAATHQLLQYINSLQETVGEVETRYTQLISTLSSHSQRLAYASGRVELLQGQFARKEAHIRLEIEESLTQRPTRDTGGDIPHSDSVSENQLQCELTRVTEERDTLASQIKADAMLLEKKVMDAKQQVTEEMDLLKGRVEQLHTEVDDKNKELASVQEELTGVRQESDEYRETIDTLKTQLAQMDVRAQQDKDTTCSQLETQYTEQLAALEHKLNEARREHTKAVVSLRQLERQMTREKERQSEHTNMLEEHYKQEMAKIDNKLRTADKDRNLLMATLRQEGLIGKYKSQRPAPAVSSDLIGPDSANQSHRLCDDIEQPTRDVDQSNQEALPWRPTAVPSTSETDDPLHTVIDDVKSLAQAILHDSDSDSADSDVNHTHPESLVDS